MFNYNCIIPYISGSHITGVIIFCMAEHHGIVIREFLYDEYCLIKSLTESQRILWTILSIEDKYGYEYAL